jgi:hypothetical protein
VSLQLIWSYGNTVEKVGADDVYIRCDHGIDGANFVCQLPALTSSLPSMLPVRVTNKAVASEYLDPLAVSTLCSSLYSRIHNGHYLTSRAPDGSILLLLYTILHHSLPLGSGPLPLDGSGRTGTTRGEYNDSAQPDARSNQTLLRFLLLTLLFPRRRCPINAGIVQQTNSSNLQGR